MAELKPDVRYEFEAIDFMDETWDQFYNLWLELSLEHALGENRTRVSTNDAKATLKQALDKLLEAID